MQKMTKGTHTRPEQPLKVFHQEQVHSRDNKYTKLRATLSIRVYKPDTKLDKYTFELAIHAYICLHVRSASHIVASMRQTSSANKQSVLPATT
eukprot:3580057-Amphidinium_carterae.2